MTYTSVITNTFFVKYLNSVNSLTVINLQSQTVLELNNVSRHDLESGISFYNFLCNTYVVFLQTKNYGVITKK
ncbi:hypothetical protein PW52_00005 [Tamlana sedimentorum]|uniref:Secretion system C-terminal sorting domain-containing protein n=1 Tax=Neotamlana sedimentorum TaxID=1435349 RepID=A0A0D7WCT9_9FLAO|nr:hypothetical protein PW52_00005 [Tamlana sedimentorum]